MKIILVSRYPQQADKPRGGIEAVTVILAKALAECRGDSVQVITLEQEKSLLGQSNVGGMNVLRLQRSRWPLFLDINMGPSRHRLAAALRQEAPAIVHFHETWGLGCIPTACPQVFTVHGFDSANIPAEAGRFPGLRSQLWKMVESKGFAKTKNIISISPYVTKQIRPYTNATIHEIDNPVDLDFFATERKEEPGRVLCVGWINARKNTLGSVRAFAKAFKSGYAKKLVIAGSAREQGYLDAMKGEIAQEGLEQHVEFLGQADRQKLKTQLGLASVLLLPSLQENAPMAISEAMAAGVPVITSNRCGMPYMVEDNRSGFLIEPEDDAQIADRLIRLLGSAELRRDMAARGREIALVRFHPCEVALKTLRAYEAALGEKSNVCNGVTASQQREARVG